MGLGDDIMATAYARTLRKTFPNGKAVFGKKDSGYMHWSEVFYGNPDILQPKEKSQEVFWVEDYVGNRQYIDYKKSNNGFSFKPDFRAPKGHIHFLPDEIPVIEEIRAAFGDNLPIIVEPNIKGAVGPNKDWGFDRWQSVVDALPDVLFLQLGDSKVRRLKGVEHAVTADFRSAMAILSLSKGFVGTDGALHHASAALNVPAVVVWGGFASPENLGYEDHINITSEDPNTPCGEFADCLHCRGVMDKITVEDVVGGIQAMEKRHG